MNPCLKKSFVQPNAPKYYELAPRNELNDRSQAVILEGQVSENLGLLGKVFFILIRFLIAIAMELAELLWRCGTLAVNQVVENILH